MRVLITGICGFVGSSIAQWLRGRDASIQVLGLDNFLRTGSELQINLAGRGCGVRRRGKRAGLHTLLQLSDQ